MALLNAGLIGSRGFGSRGMPEAGRMGTCGAGESRTEDANLAWLLAKAPFVVK